MGPLRLMPLLSALGLLSCAPTNRPPKPSSMIVQEYFACTRCGSLHGGNFGKGPTLALRTPAAPSCRHQWQLIALDSFQLRGERDFPSEWAQAPLFFKREPAAGADDMKRCPQAWNDPDTTVTYSDGSANRYLIVGGALEYRPVSAARSSSGVYDGGAPWKAQLDAGRYAELAQVVDRAILAGRVGSAGGRAMLTGLVEIRRGDQSASWVLEAKAPEKQALEDALERLHPPAAAGP